jgi:hypothetical protein
MVSYSMIPGLSSGIGRMVAVMLRERIVTVDE